MGARVGWVDAVLRYVAPVTLAIVSIAFLLVAAPLKPLAAVLGGAVGAIILLFASAIASRPPGKHARAVLLLLGIALLALLVGVFSRPAPSVSIAGVVGQHNGWVLWVSASAWFAAGALLGAGRPFRMSVWCVAVLGAILAGAALLDPLLADVVNYSPEPSGLMENSISLAQLLLLGIGSSAALVAMETRAPLRLGALALAVLQVAGLMVSGARAAQMMSVLAAIVGALWVNHARLGKPARRAILVVLGVAVIGLGWVAYSALWEPSPWVEQLLTARPTIWRTGLAQAADRLVVGGGPDRFTSLVEWRNTSSGVSWQTTTSPHNILLDWLLGGGVLALLTFVSAAAVTARGIVRRLVVAPVAPKLLAVAVGAWAFSLLISWVDPLSALIAALFSGVLLSESAPPVSPSPASRGALAASAAALAAVLIVTVPLVGLETGWVRDHRAGTVGYEVAQARWQRWPDPAFGSDAVRASLETLPEHPDEAGQLAGSIMRLTPWDANGIAGALQLSVTLESLSPGVAHPDVASVLEAARAADPASGLWDELESAVSGSPATGP